MEVDRTNMGIEEQKNKYVDRYGRRKRRDKGLIWAWKDCYNREEWNTIETTVKELAMGLVKQESGYVKDKVGKQDAKGKAPKKFEKIRIRTEGWKTVGS